MKHWLRPLTIAAIFCAAYGTVARADTIDFSGSITGTASMDLSGRCAPFPTVNAAATGTATLLGQFMDVQSDCRTSQSEFDQGLFQFTSLLAPDDSLFGTYFAVASSQDGTLDFTSILLVTGGTGAFTGDFGAIFGFGTLEESTGRLSETFSGQLEIVPTPEPGSGLLMASVFASLWFFRRKRR